MCRGIPAVLMTMYTAEAWWINARASFYKAGESKEIEEFLIPSQIDLRIGAGEKKRRNPKVRGSIGKTMVESVMACLGVELSYQQA